LIRIDGDLQHVLESAVDDFERRYRASVGKHQVTIRDVVSQTLALLQRAPRDPAWGGYLAVDQERGQVIGTCGFKHGPEKDGSVEIAYFTFSEFEGQGYATAMAKELLRMALAFQGIREVIAYTLPLRNASTRVLEKVGLRWVGETVDPEDGTVWRWAYRPEV
jgi:RimJ/RimL family protein N-acetyltransferase